MYFHGIPDENAFGDSITSSFYNVSSKIPSIVKEGWGYIINATEDEYDNITSTMNLCYPIENQTSLNNLYLHFMNGYSYMAMTNYPYPSDFLEPMPAWPVNETKYSFENVDETPPTEITWDRKAEVLTAIYNSS